MVRENVRTFEETLEEHAGYARDTKRFEISLAP